MLDLTRHSNSLRKPISLFSTTLIAVLAFTLPGVVAARSGDDESGAAGETEIAILAGGCFWGMEDLLRELEGVLDTEVGYAVGAAGGNRTGAEAVRIVFDPKRITYEEILRFYFTMHDPTTRNRQGNDRGAEYRSAIFTLSDDQREIAERVRAEVDASEFWNDPVVTEIDAADDFKVAREYHQDYLEKNPGGYSCHYVRTGSGNG